MKELEIKITWANGVEFLCKAKRQDGSPGEWKTVTRVEENGHISAVWANIQATVLDYLRANLVEIGEEMKSS